MREENYFKIKLENCKETLAMAQSKIEHLDIMMENLRIRFEYDQKVYNDQAIHMQEIIKDMKTRIPKLERQIKKGYKAVNIRTGKGYKSFEARHKAHLEAKRLEAEANYEAAQARIKKKHNLLEDKNKAITPEEKDILHAAQIQADMQPEEDIKTLEEKQLENLRKKQEYYEQQIKELQEKAKGPIQKEEPYIKSGLKSPWEPNDAPTEADQKPQTKKEFIEEIEKAAEAAQQKAEEASKAIQFYADNLERIPPTWIVEFETRFPKKAIWQGRITNDFKDFILENGWAHE